MGAYSSVVHFALDGHLWLGPLMLCRVEPRPPAGHQVLIVVCSRCRYEAWIATTLWARAAASQEQVGH
jgi:hypothetical protein